MYLTFTPLPAPRRRGRPCRAGARGVSPPVSPEPGAYLRGTESPLDAEKPPEGGFLRVLRVLRVYRVLRPVLNSLAVPGSFASSNITEPIRKLRKFFFIFHYLFLSGKHSFVFPQLIFYSGSIIAQRSKSRKRKRVRNKQSVKNIFRYYHQTVRSNSLSQ